MASNNEIGFIKEEIEKSGFPFEFKVATILKKNGWDVLPSSPYWDRDEGKWREIDIKAYKSFWVPPTESSTNPYGLTLALIIECKKTEKFGWVFFPWPRKSADMQRVWINYHDFLTIVKRQSLLKGEMTGSKMPLPTEFQMLDLDPALIVDYESLVTPEIAKELRFFSDLKIITPDAFGFLRSEMKSLSFKEVKLKKRGKVSERHEIFEALNMLIKATKYDMELHSTGIYAAASLAKKDHEKGKFEIAVWLPILMFGGELYTWINGNVETAGEILVEGRCHTRHYFENVVINVVRERRFEEFLSKIEENHRELLNRIVDKRDELDDQVKMIKESPYFSGGPVALRA